MEITEKQELTKLMRDLWTGFFPTKDTHPDEVPTVVQNKDWVRESLLFYGWKPNKFGKLDIDMKYIDGGAVLYSDSSPCLLVSIDQSGDEPKLRFTYVDNRAQ